MLGKQVARIRRTENRPWGSFIALDTGIKHQVKRITVNPHCRISLQSHCYRDEYWIVVHGCGKVTVDAEVMLLHVGDRVYIPKKARHRLENLHDTTLEVIEVQIGSYLGEDDIFRYTDDYGREETLLHLADSI